MKLIIKRLTEEHLPLVDAFFCTESKEELKDYNSKTRRRIRAHSDDMDKFLKNEAFDDQNKGLNTTHLFIDTETNKLVAYISLCNDSIRLELDERSDMNLSYATVPAVKIARLAVSNEYKHKGIGKSLIHFAAYIGQEVRKVSGLTFITLDCYEHRLSFYESFGFVKNLIQPIQKDYDSPISMRLALDEYLQKVADELDPEPATTPHQEVAATTDHPTSYQPSSDPA